MSRSWSCTLSLRCLPHHAADIDHGNRTKFKIGRATLVMECNLPPATIAPTASRGGNPPDRDKQRAKSSGSTMSAKRPGWFAFHLPAKAQREQLGPDRGVVHQRTASLPRLLPGKLFRVPATARVSYSLNLISPVRIHQSTIILGRNAEMNSKRRPQKGSARGLVLKCGQYRGFKVRKLRKDRDPASDRND